MGVRVTYVCEKCGYEWLRDSKERQPVMVGICVMFGAVSTHGVSDSQIQNPQMWCRECVMKEGIYPPVNDEDKKVAPETPPSFEEILAELIESLGFTRE
jgi:hypothetical protein